MATEAACLGIFDWDLQSQEVHWSKYTRQIFGVGQETVVTPELFHDRLHPEDRKRVLEAMHQARLPEGTGEYDIEYRIFRSETDERIIGAKGSVHFETIGGERRARRFLGTILDRTEQVRSHAALAQAEQLATTGRLAASIAHEINNPLEAVTNILYLLREEQDESTRREYLRMAESELARASEIASNTLRFYRDPKGQTRVGLTALIQSVVGLFQGRLAIRGVDLSLSCQEGAEVTATQGELRQVLVNLVGNAIDAMPEGGRLYIRSRRFTKPVGSIIPGVHLFIADTGSGMNEAVLRRLFEPFYTTKGSSGTGLGLWLSQEILKKHGFRLTVRSKPHHGTVFHVYMPEDLARLA